MTLTTASLKTDHAWRRRGRVADEKVGCASMSRQQKGAVIGAGSGAVIGGVIGDASGHTALGAIIGAAVGGAAGAYIGNYMDNQAEILTKYDDTLILIEGHTDSSGSEEYNLTLSRSRAQSVANRRVELAIMANDKLKKVAEDQAK